MVRTLLAALSALSLSACFAVEAPKPEPPKKPVKLEPGTYARIATAEGEIVIRLLTDKAPNTTRNFIELAKGERPFKDLKGRWVQRPFYDGLTFHRIEDGNTKLIQGGCPKGDGTGGPGYKFEDEIDKERKFDKPGLVAMANSGRNTQGSQFFIICAAAKLPPDYTIFGEVVAGLDVVEAISKMPAKAIPSGPGRPPTHKALQPVAMTSVVIEEVKDEAAEKDAEKKG